MNGQLFQKYGMWLLPILLVVLARPSLAAPPPAAATLEYNRDVRPILAENCFYCHGQDANKRQAGLRLDRAEAAYAKLPSGKIAVVPGKVAASEMAQRIGRTGPGLMPPAGSGKQLTAKQIATLKQWIAQGAPYEAHWAYIPPKRPVVPVVKAAGWARTPIDRFVLAQIEQEGLHPSPTADRRTLIRRLSLDLTGLPPTPEEVEAFVNDRSPEGYAKVVDRLLASSQYGERMAAYWLDMVRYADTDGYHGDRYRSVYPFRDYVIQAFNSNMPFDRFTTEQIAGDLLPNATLEQKVASGYNRLNMITREGGAQAKEYLAKYTAERIRTTSEVWLGATLGCAECHDHKFDPYKTKDFYRFGAFFADLQQVGVYDNSDDLPPSMAVPSPEQAQQQAQLESQIAGLKKTLETPTPELAAAQAAWEQSLAGKLPAWTVLRPDSLTTQNGTILTLQSDGSLLASGKNPEVETYTLSVRTRLHGITAFRVELLPDPSLPRNGPGRAGNGNLVLTHLDVLAQPAAGGAPQAIGLQHASASFEQKFAAEGSPTKLFSASLAITGKKDDLVYGWAVMEEAGKENQAVFETTADLGTGDETQMTFVLVQNHPGHGIGRFRLSATTAPRPVTVTPGGLPGSIATLLGLAPAQRTPEQQAALAAYYRSIAPALQPVRAQLAEAEKHRLELEKTIPRMLISVSVKPMTIRVLPRGNWMDDSGEIVQPGVPAFLPQLPPSEPANRLALAKWLVSKDNPLTARVMVNRLWMLFFGAGIVRTPGDLGTQGAWPTHPELLDWLATEFMDSGWDIKHMIRLMVLSNTYKQTSQATKALEEKDPYNRLLARQGRFRLDAEAVRDNALAISGLLSRKIGGRSVKPYQPDGYWALCNTFAGPLIYDQDHHEDLYRRGLYTIWKRTFLHPSLLAFDAPTREECVVERPRSNTPLQALVLLNDPTYVEAARVFAAHIVQEGGSSVSNRIDLAFRRAVARDATPKEVAVLADLYKRHLAAYLADEPDAQKLVTTGESPVPSEIRGAELAAWTSVARVILNLHETVTRE